MKKKSLVCVILFIISILPLYLLTACEKNYDGPDGISIEYVTVDYMGAAKQYSRREKKTSVFYQYRQELETNNHKITKTQNRNRYFM